MVFNLISAVAILTSFVLPICALVFWISWYRNDRHQYPAWRRAVGCIAALCATGAIVWQHAFPIILHRHYLLAGGEDNAWWALLISSIRIGLSLSLAGLLLGLLGKKRTRIFAVVSSVLMGLTYFVLFSIR